MFGSFARAAQVLRAVMGNPEVTVENTTFTLTIRVVSVMAIFRQFKSSCSSQSPVQLAGDASERLEVFHQLLLLLRCEPKRQQLVVVLNDFVQRLEAAVVVKAALLVTPQAGERSSAIHMRRRTVCLEGIHAHFAR